MTWETKSDKVSERVAAAMRPELRPVMELEPPLTTCPTELALAIVSLEDLLADIVRDVQPPFPLDVLRRGTAGPHST